MRRKSIGARSQAFHEPMSTGAFLEFLTRLGCRDAGLRGLLARSPGAFCPAQRLKCWSEDGKPASHGTVKLRLWKPSNAPQCQRIGGYGSTGRMGLKLKTRLAGSERSAGGLGAGPPGLGARPTRDLGPKQPGESAETAASEVGTWKKRSRDTPPIQARLPGLSNFAVFSCCVGNQSAQQARLPGLCRTNTALLSNPHQHARPRVLRPGPQPSGA